VLSPSLCLLRSRAGALLAVRVSACRDDGRVVRADPAALLSAVHAWLGSRTVPGPLPVTLTAVVGGRPFRVELTTATTAEADALL
jgi:hypothetical protein